jgi:hypothetical protein
MNMYKNKEELKKELELKSSDELNNTYLEEFKKSTGRNLTIGTFNEGWLKLSNEDKIYVLSQLLISNKSVKIKKTTVDENKIKLRRKGTNFDIQNLFQ